MKFLIFILFLPINLSAQLTESEPTLLEQVQISATRESNLSTPSTLIVPQQGSTDLSDEIQYLPNIGFSGGSNRPRHIQVRGLGERSRFEHMQVSSVGVFLEGIDLSEESSILPLGFGESLNIHYGPQTIRWGSKAIAGSIEVSEDINSPRFIEGLLGSYETAMGRALFNTKLGNTNVILAGSLLKSDGFYINNYFDEPKNTRDEGQILISAESLMSRYKLRQTHLFSLHDNGYDVWNFDNDLTTYSDRPGKDKHRVFGHSLQINPNSESEGGLSSLTSITHTSHLESYDEDWGNDSMWQDLPGWQQDYDYSTRFDRQRLKAHQKLSYAWHRGLEIGWHSYYFSEQQDARSYRDGTVRRRNDTELISENHGVWVSQSQRLKTFLLTGALRGELQRVSFIREDEKLSDQYHDFAWLLQASHTPRPDLSLSYLVQKGFRGGGFNNGVDLTDKQRSFAPESLYHFEVSATKSFEFSEITLRSFHYSYVDQQIQSSEQSDPTDPNSYIYFTDNVARSRITGLEAMALGQVGSHRIQANLGLLDSKFESYELSGVDLKDRALPHSPQWTALARWSWQLKDWTFYTQVHGRDTFYYSDDHNHKSPAAVITDLGIKHLWSTLQSEFFISNVFDKDHYLRAYYFANEPPDWEPKLYEQRGSPRTLGLRLQWFW